jgi:hypothetical protein
MDKRFPYGTAARLGSLLGALSVMMLVTLYPAAPPATARRCPMAC